MSTFNRNRNRSAEPILDPANSPYLTAGLELFNAGEHWHAHEEWEHLWLGIEGDDKVFLQALIMSAAMLVQYKAKIPGGVKNHYQNVKNRLAVASDRWGFQGQELLANLRPFFDDATSSEPTYQLSPNIVIRRLAND